MSRPIERVHYSHYWVRNWVYRSNLNSEQRRREVQRWEDAVSSPAVFRANRIKLVGQATNRLPGEVLTAWGIRGIL